MHFLISWFLWLKVIPKVRTFKPFLDLPRVDSALTQSFNRGQKQFHPGPPPCSEWSSLYDHRQVLQRLGEVSPHAWGVSLLHKPPLLSSVLGFFPPLSRLQRTYSSPGESPPRAPPAHCTVPAGKTWQTVGFASFCISPA